MYLKMLIITNSSLYCTGRRNLPTIIIQVIFPLFYTFCIVVLYLSQDVTFFVEHKPNAYKFYGSLWSVSFCIRIFHQQKYKYLVWICKRLYIHIHLLPKTKFVILESNSRKYASFTKLELTWVLYLRWRKQK